MENERIDIYNDACQPTGLTIPRKNAHLGDGQYMLYVYALIENNDGKFLITQRTLDKHWAAGSWEVTGGGVCAGETPSQAIVREVVEETGLDVSYLNLEPVYTYKNVDLDSGDNYFAFIYHFKFTFSASDITLQRSEAIDFKLATWDEIGRLNARNTFLHYERLSQALNIEKLTGTFDEKSAVVFDYDGTLADTSPAIMRTAHRVLSEYGMTDEQMGDLRRLIGPPFPMGYTLIYGIPHEDAVKLTARYRDFFAQLGPDDYPLFDGMEDLLRKLKAQGRRLTVASSKRNDLVHRMLDEQGVLDLFDAVCGTDDNATTDKAGLIQKGLDVIGAAPSEAVMIGDRHYDIEAGHKAGMPAIGVLYGGTVERQELEDAHAEAIVTSVAELGLALGVSR